jgi:hypothetical protein
MVFWASAKNLCIVSDFYGLSWINEPTLRHIELSRWLTTNGDSCSSDQLVGIWNNLALWAGVADSAELRGKDSLLLRKSGRKGEEVITLDKWYPMVQPTHTATQLAFDKAVEKVQEEHRYAIAANKLELKTIELDIELYDKRARQNTIELGSFENRRRFQIFV